MSIKILYSNDSAQWRSYLNRLPPHLLDIHFRPEMVLPYEAAGWGRGMLAVVNQYDEFMIQPFIKMNDGHLHHAYNFGGPVATPGFHPVEIPYPHTCLLNPFLAHDQLRLLNGGEEYVKDIVWIDLSKPLQLRQTTRHMAQKAETAGVTVERVEATPENVKLFSSMYDVHMEAIGAAAHWRFPLVWIRVLLAKLGNKMSSLFFAKHENRVVGCCILIHAHGTCYYHLATSSRDIPGVAQRMVLCTSDWARQEGYVRFHLGGGVQPNDSLFTFKAGFSPLRLPVYRYHEEEHANPGDC